MKLLSRFIWLLIAIGAIVFIGVSLVNLRAENKFKEIKASISQEYNILIDKMLSPDRSEINTTYNYGIINASTTRSFLSGSIPVPELLAFDLDTMVMNHFLVDAIWFYQSSGNQFYFFSHHGVGKEVLSISASDINSLFGNTKATSFYIKNNGKLYRVFGSRVGDEMDNVGFVFSASIQDDRWVDIYQKEINNSEAKFSGVETPLPEVPKEYILIERPLLSYNGKPAENLLITLKLPFLSLWKSTTTTDNWLMSGAIGLIVIFLTLSLLLWVISPLKRISKSLQKGDAEDIKPLMDNTTEMGNVARMISDYHQKNEEIEASESTKRHIIEQVQVGIIISDAASSLIITANPYACEIINAPEDAILGNITQNFFAPLSDELKNKLKNTTENLTGIESFIQSSTGEQIPILRNVTRMFMDGKHAIMETFINLSEIKSLQNKLEDEKKKHSLAMKNSGLVFCEYDFKTDEILLSDEWKFMLKGKSNSNAQNIINNIYPSDYKSITDHFSSLSSGARDTLTSEFRVQHPERGIIWVNLSVLITKRDEAHKPKQLIGLLEDITERISIQQELIKAKERAEESDRQKSAYLGNMSHKIRTPLNTIVGFSNLLTEDDISHQEKDNYINIIRHDTEQVLHLIDDIINIAKIDANQLDTNDKECSINEMFNSLSEYYKTNEKTNRIEFVTKQMLPNGKDILKTDADKLHQILNNLLNNAFKFTNEGKIELGYFINPVEEKMIIYVKDTGIGIQNEHKDKVFNHFYQANQTTEGTGLGLTISQSLVKLIGGKLNFESKEGEGSTFFVELPFKEV